MFETRKLFVLLAAGAFSLALAQAGFSANLVVNGDFATGASGWTMLNTVNGDDWVAANYSGTVGYPAGSVKLERTVTYPSLATNGHRYYQFIPVEPNATYTVRGQWKGDLSAGAAGGSWAEVYIGFTVDANENQPSWSNIRRYRKSWDGVNNVNVSATGQWDWENIATSPQGTPPSSFTAQAGQRYMVIAFNLGGNALEPYTAQPYFYIDNIVVVACSQWLGGDANSDCVVDFTDLSLFMNQWLTCNLDPASSCW